MSTITTPYSLQWQSATTGKVLAAHAISAMSDADALRVCTLLLRRVRGVHGVTCYCDQRLVAWLPAPPMRAPWDEHGIPRLNTTQRDPTSPCQRWPELTVFACPD
jgi:hypothetical protein